MDYMSRKRIPPPPRRVFLIRHGEQCDLNYGYEEWISLCFTPEGDYIRTDLNLPLMVPKRYNARERYKDDAPVTHVGAFQSKLIGQNLKNLGVVFRYAFAAPALRCIQTLDMILLEMKLKDSIPINVEPGFFDLVTWYKDTGVPHWMTYQELADAGLNININYIQAIRRDQLLKDEKVDDFYKRNHFILKGIIEATQELGGDIVIVGYSSTLEVCSRIMVGQHPRSHEQLFCIVQEVPYCAIVTVKKKAEKFSKNEADWTFEDTSVPHFSYTRNEHYNWYIIRIPNFMHSKRDPFHWQILVSPDLMSRLLIKYQINQAANLAIQ